MFTKIILSFPLLRISCLNVLPGTPASTSTPAPTLWPTSTAQARSRFGRQPHEREEAAMGTGGELWGYHMGSGEWWALYPPMPGDKINTWESFDPNGLFSRGRWTEESKSSQYESVTPPLNLPTLAVNFLTPPTCHKKNLLMCSVMCLMSHRSKNRVFFVNRIHAGSYLLIFTKRL